MRRSAFARRLQACQLTCGGRSVLHTGWDLRRTDCTVLLLLAAAPEAS
jgi:hypothetical protein